MMTERVLSAAAVLVLSVCPAFSQPPAHNAIYWRVSIVDLAPRLFQAQ
jgi:hypothetical protein